MAPAESIIFVTQPGRNTLSHAVASVVAVSLLLLLLLLLLMLPANRLVKMHFKFCLSAICVALFAAQLTRFFRERGRSRAAAATVCLLHLNFSRDCATQFSCCCCCCSFLRKLVFPANKNKHWPGQSSLGSQ